MNKDKKPLALYSTLADWWPVLSSPDEYAEEAAFFQEVITSTSPTPPHTVLELGSGGGNNASHLKKHFHMTLVDLSPEMLEVSRKLNPGCEHIQGDMRTVRLNREFDAVFINDAIDYMCSESDLTSALETAYIHCKPGGVALFVPDHTRETFKPSTQHGGHDVGDRSLRYLEWTWDPDEGDTTYLTVMSYLLHEGEEEVRNLMDQHILGLFPHDDWLKMMTSVGFQARSMPFEHSELEPGSAHVFLGIKPGMAKP